MEIYQIINLFNGPYINKSGIASILYQKEIEAGYISREGARKRLVSKISGNTHFSNEEEKQLKQIFVNLESEVITTEYGGMWSYGVGQYVTKDEQVFKIINFDPIEGKPAEVVDLFGNDNIIEFDKARPIRFDDIWAEKFGYKEGDIITHHIQNKQSLWKLKKAGTVYYICCEHQNGNENPVLGTSYVHEFQHYYRLITKNYIFIKEDYSKRIL